MISYVAKVGPVKLFGLCDDKSTLHSTAGDLTPKQHLRQRQQALKAVLLNGLDLHDLLVYDRQGRPFLRDGRFISLSHSGACVMLALSERPVGLDIQTPDDRLLRLTAKFMHPAEQAYFSSSSLTELLRLWTAKEAVYKWAGRNGLSLARDIIIRPDGREGGRALILSGNKTSLQDKEVQLTWFTFAGQQGWWPVNGLMRS